jgi:ankyrin repeat protein
MVANPFADGQILKAILQSNQYYNIDEFDNTGHTALAWAIQFGYEEVVQILLDNGANANAQGESMAMPYKQHHTVDVRMWCRYSSTKERM